MYKIIEWKNKGTMNFFSVSRTLQIVGKRFQVLTRLHFLKRFSA